MQKEKILKSLEVKTEHLNLIEKGGKILGIDNLLKEYQKRQEEKREIIKKETETDEVIDIEEVEFWYKSLMKFKTSKGLLEFTKSYLEEILDEEKDKEKIEEIKRIIGEINEEVIDEDEEELEEEI